MIKTVLTSLVLTLCATPLFAVTKTCEGTPVTLNYHDDADFELACEAVETAQRLFAQCNVPELVTPLRIDILQTIDPGCVGQFHCGDQLIEVLSPAKMQTVRDVDGVFGFLPINTYFQSVIVHELAHASYDPVPCPHESCRATHEYVAYTMQIMSLPQAARDSFDTAANLNRNILVDELNAMSLFLAPDLFVQKVWTHFSRQDDRCSLIGQIIEGKMFFDRTMP